MDERIEKHESNYQSLCLDIKSMAVKTEQYENIPEQIKNLNEAIGILNTKLDAIHESMQTELARFDEDLQKIADLESKNQEDIAKLNTGEYL